MSMHYDSYAIEKIVDESINLPSLEDLDEVGHHEDLDQILAVIAE